MRTSLFKQEIAVTLALAVAAGVFAFGPAAFAEETDSTTETRNVLLSPERLRQAADKKREEAQRVLEVRFENLKVRATERKEAVKSDVAARLSSTTNTIDRKREEARERYEENKKRIVDAAKERIENYVEKFVERLEAAVDRLINIANRIESRIEKLKARGVDMAEAVRLLQVAREKIVTAEVEVRGISAALDSVLSAENPKESFAIAKKEIREAHSAIVIAQKALSEAVKAIRVAAGTKADDDENDDDKEKKGDSSTETTNTQ